MPVEAKPLFRPDVLRAHLQGFASPTVDTVRPKLVQWAELIRSGRVDALNERELLPDFLTDLFVHLLRYEGPPGRDGVYTLSREQHVEVEGQFADAALGRFSAGKPADFVVAVEGKGGRGIRWSVRTPGAGCPRSTKGTSTPSTCRATG